MIITALSRLSKWYYVLLFFVASFSFQYWLITKLLPVFLEYSGGIKNPDQLFWYSTPWLYKLYMQLGEQGRSFYQKMLTIDFGYLICTALAFATLLYNLTFKTVWTRICVLPLVAAFLDLMENSVQFWCLAHFSDLSTVMVFLSSLCSFLKMILGAVSMLAILVFSTRYFYLKLNSKP